MSRAKKKRSIFYLLCARLCYSCRPVVLTSQCQNEESFLVAFVRTFRILNGLPAKMIFDNGKDAVKDDFCFHARKQDGYTELSAHCGFEALFFNHAGEHEKVLAEGLVGWQERIFLFRFPSRKDRCIQCASDKDLGIL